MTKHMRAPGGRPTWQPTFSLLACVISICWLWASPVASGQQEKLDTASAASGERATGTTHSSQSLRQLNTSLVALTLRLPGRGSRNRLACVAIDLLPAARHVEALGLLELGAAIISIQSSRV
jgi:hypothetical protein